uniref:Cleavage and polyadenylation specificity factor subunit 6 n=1 Tax=Aceria tosichella TaxID=561515 RepID=A0A6G1SF06_9ACAR
MADILYAGAGGDVAATEDNANEFYGPGAYGNNNTTSGGLYNSTQVPPRPRYPALYVGNLTWWTTDRDVIDAINSIGVDDVQEVKFFENRNNGQSKGYCVVTFSSDASLQVVMDKLPAKELHGQNPVVVPYNRQNLNLFENPNKPRPPISSTNGPTTHGAGIMGINSITGVHAAAAAANAQVAAATAVANIPYAGVAPTVGATGPVGLGYNQPALGMNALGGTGVPRPFHHTNMRMQMRGPRPAFVPRGTMMGGLNNGPMMASGHQMNRMRFMSQQNWNNNQGGGGGGGYNSAANRVGPQMNPDISNRLGVAGGVVNKQDDSSSDMMGSSSYYNSHHSNSQSDHYRGDMRDHRDHREPRDERDVRRLDDRPSRLDDRSLRHDDRIRDDRSSKQDDRMDRVRRDDRSSRKVEDDRSGSRRSDERRDRDDRSSRREEKSSSRHHRERSHRSNDRARSRSRSKDRSRDGKERRDRDRDRDRERDRDRRERY